MRVHIKKDSKKAERLKISSFKRRYNTGFSTFSV